MLLFYNMGTGKTYTSIAAAYEYTVKYPEYRRIIVLLKTGLEGTWIGSF
jgi:predicted ribonuclease YlaK